MSKGQPQKPVPFKQSLIGPDKPGMVYLQSEADPYISHLEARVEELEKSYRLIIAYCEVSIEALKGFEGDQSEYDGMYQAMSDLLEKINGNMPWPDLAIERLSQ